ncbi:chromatin structure-remodeling complex subunit RSC1/2 [Blastomyces parvus]|uniref:Chromatin structure-remodeling complex subunit RSC1/2 n=1 Tax=Blastomyces parvus TaxID=2060905 RepID=A0A2B7WM77_9EURO|nr:chromatin structure-remodeling complex subunit RSC1/2 [Blastomyces parvus]
MTEDSAGPELLPASTSASASASATAPAPETETVSETQQGGNLIQQLSEQANQPTEQPDQPSQPSQTPEAPDTPQPSRATPADSKQNEGSNPEHQVTDEQWRAMFDILLAIYDYREPDGYDPSRLFHRSVNKRNVPDYYDVIKEPMALSVLKQKIKNKSYTDFAEFVRDCALIPHNAQTYNRPKSQAYEDALVIKDVFISEFGKLVEQGIISSETAELPDLGEIPDADPLPVEEDEDEDEAEDDSDDEAEDSDDEAGRRKRKRPTRGSSKRESGAKDDPSKINDPELRKKRGRPPRVDTPMEARIKAVLKGIRKFKDSSGQLKVRHFERLPDKAAYPDYFSEIKDPMAIDLIKRKSKRKKYNSVDHFMKDMDLMFNNAKAYNQVDSQIYRDAATLQSEARKLADQEKKKPDSEYLMEDGRLPLPNGILHKGELWKVGDWVHIQNPNDVTKPIVAQIYRTWQDAEGQKWVNACWYYRPEQTVHQYEKHFYPNEVVKTGQYRDHRIGEVVDRCFVMFFTRYNRGRPRGLAPDKQVYVCEARYNEEKHKLNKIKTWASCLPDEVREKDYEMDLFDAPRKIKKIPSPIKHLLKEDAKETDDVPKPTWGAENAPPIVGAVHRRPREENESPPPEPTPSPPPQLPAPPAAPVAPQRQMSINRAPTRQSMDSPSDYRMSASPLPSLPTRSPGQPTPHAPPATPQPPITLTRMQQPFPPQSVAPTPAAPVYPASHLNHRPGLPFATQTPQSTPIYQQPLPQPYSAPHNFPSYQANRYHPQPHPIPQPHFQQQSQLLPHPQSQPQPILPPNIYNPNAPRPVETFILSDNANAAIPEEIRRQFHCDEKGRVLFFTSPPLDVVPPAEQTGLGHSLRYLAAKKERAKLIEKRRLEKKQMEQERAAKRLKMATSTTATGTDACSIDNNESLATADRETLSELALMVAVVQMKQADRDWYRMRYGEEDVVKIKEADDERYMSILKEKAKADAAARKLDVSEPASIVPIVSLGAGGGGVSV